MLSCEMSRIFILPFTAEAGHIDELGHVNNAVWVQWMEHLSVSHWRAHAPAAEVEASVWMVTRHEIDYRGNVTLGQGVTGTTWIDELPRGARFNRRMLFRNEDGRTVVEAKTTWAMLDAVTHRLLRVPPHLAEHFMAQSEDYAAAGLPIPTVLNK